MKKITESIEFAGKTLSFETGELAPQATSAILARLGDTMVLATVTLGKETVLDYFPLSVDYVERLYAGGRIKGSRWVKREGRPTDECVLTGRLIDRSIRPLFPKDYKREVQIIVTVLSIDTENDPDILSVIAVSAAIAMSPIPWNGPIGSIRMGFTRGENGEVEYLLNPTSTLMASSELDLVLSQSKDKTIMIESGANQIPEEVMIEAIKRAHGETAKTIDFIESFVKKAGQQKESVKPDSEFLEMVKRIEKAYQDEVKAIEKLKVEKESNGSDEDEIINKIYNQEKLADPAKEIDRKVIAKAIEYVMFKNIRNNVVKNKKRVDGRKMDEIRPITIKVGLLPRTHGSAMFQRGLTQALTVATLGSPRLEQLIESAEGEESKSYIHHYSMPPYSVGETGRVGSLSRREIGHGALAERALEPVIPSKEKFPYTIRLVSEITSSNGSTSMASTCGSTLALMDAGVPISKPVAGISVGMMSAPAGSTKKDEYVLLTDITGLEDFSGDMDFKVAGTDTGITAIQLDVKIPGLTVEQISQIFDRAKTARLSILEKMQAVISQSRAVVSEFAPKIELLQIPVDKIGEVIGPGGRVIKNIIASTGATVDVEDDGVVTISGTSEEVVEKAKSIVQGITREVHVGEVFEDAVVRRILPFGAFVEFLPAKEGMVHVSKMIKGFVKHPEDVVTIGQKVTVKVIEIDEQGRINLSMLLDDDSGPAERQETGERERNNDRGFGYQDRGRGNRGTFNREPRKDRADRGDRTERQPLHPLSRQFQRERSQQRRPSSGRKTHY